MSDNISTLTDESAEDSLGGDLPILIDFFANWCMPCKMLAPIIDEIAEECDGKIRVLKANADSGTLKLVKRFGISALPTLVILKDGEVVKKLVGASSKTAIIETIEDIID